MTLFVFALCVLGALGLCDLWFKGSLFALARARARARAEFGRTRLSRFLGGLLSCRFCAGHWAALAATLSAWEYVPAWLAPAWWLAVRRCVGYLEAANDWLDAKHPHHELSALADGEGPEEESLGGTTIEP